MFIPKKVGDELMAYVYRDPYDFILGNCNTGEVYRNFNKIDMDGVDDPTHNAAQDDSDSDSSDISDA